MIDLEKIPLKAIVATVDAGRDAGGGHDEADEAEASLDELVLLLSNLGVETLGRAVQRRRSPDPGVYIGRGKALEIKEFAAQVGANLLVIDGALTPTQRSNLKKLTALDIWDRAYTIMMIFEQRAVTAEAKLQVELAQLRYEIPSLKGLGHQMSRLGGGIGTRGPGETEFERHRRKLERRIKFIERSLKDVTRRRGEHRYRRARSGLPVVSLVGYTNGGKSTLLRALSRDAGIAGEDKLFATLDTVTRRIDLPDCPQDAFMLSDTVGFIRHLPTELIAAFRATLEEVTAADLLILVLDASDPEPMRSYEIVRATLEQIGAGEVPRIVAVNKIDRAREESVFVAAGLSGLGGLGELGEQGEEVARISALRGEGLRELVSMTADRLRHIRKARSEELCT